MPRDLELASRIKQYRQACGLTQKQLTQALNLDPTSISQYERGIARPKLETLSRMADIFSVSLDTLLTGAPSRAELHDEDPSFQQSIVNRFSHLTQEEQLLIFQFRQLTDEQRAIVLQDVHRLFE